MTKHTFETAFTRQPFLEAADNEVPVFLQRVVDGELPGFVIRNSQRDTLDEPLGRLGFVLDERVPIEINAARFGHDFGWHLDGFPRRSGGVQTVHDHYTQHGRATVDLILPRLGAFQHPLQEAVYDLATNTLPPDTILERAWHTAELNPGDRFVFAARGERPPAHRFTSQTERRQAHVSLYNRA